MSKRAGIDIEKPEKRTFELQRVEIRAGQDGKKVLRGHAAVFDKLSVNLGGFREYVRPGAFANSISTDDIRSLWNHNTDIVLGRNLAKTLTLSEDKEGLAVELLLPDTQAGRDAEVSVSRGDVTQMSFSFRTLKDRWFVEEEEERRELLEVKLYEVSPVTFPAYPDTDISAIRSAVGCSSEELAAALALAASGKELRSDQSRIIEAVDSLIVKFRSKQVLPEGVGREAEFDILNRRLDLTEV